MNFHFESAIYKGFYKKSNISISLVEHAEFPDYINFIHALLAGSDQWKLANRIENFFHYLITMYRVIQERSNIATSFAEHQEFSEQMSSKHRIWVSSDKLKSTNCKKQPFENTIYRPLHKRSHITASFEEHH